MTIIVLTGAQYFQCLFNQKVFQCDYRHPQNWLLLAKTSSAKTKLEKEINGKLQSWCLSSLVKFILLFLKQKSNPKMMHHV